MSSPEKPLAERAREIRDRWVAECDDIILKIERAVNSAMGLLKQIEAEPERAPLLKRVLIEKLTIAATRSAAARKRYCVPQAYGREAEEAALKAMDMVKRGRFDDPDLPLQLAIVKARTVDAWRNWVKPTMLGERRKRRKR